MNALSTFLSRYWREWIKPHKAAVSSCTGFILFVWIFTFLVVGNDQRVNLQSVEQDNDQLARAFAEHVQQSLKGIDQQLHLLKLEYERSGTVTPAIQLIFTETLNNPQTQQSFIADAAGNVISSAVFLAIPNLADRDYFQAHTASTDDKIHISEPMIGRSTGKTAVTLSRRINKPNGSFGGVVAIGMDPENFSRFYKDMELGPHRTVRLIGTDGIVLANQDPSTLKPGLSMASAQLFTELKRSPVGRYKSAGRLFGAPCYYSYRLLPDYPLLVQVGIEATAATAEADARENIYLIIAASVSVLVFILAVVVIRNSRRQQFLEVAARQREVNFTTFFNSIEDFLFVLDEVGRIIKVNETVLRRLGYTEADMLGQPVLMVHPEQRRDEAGEIVMKMLAGTADYCPVPLIAKNGELIPVETRVTAGAWNGSPAIFGVSKDISALKISEEKLSKIFQTTSALMAVSTLEEGIYLDVNDAFLNTLGFERNEVLGKRSTDLHIFWDPDVRAQLMQQQLLEGKVRNREVELRNRAGGTIFGLFSADIVNVAEYRLLISTMTDVTELKLAEKALQKSEERFALSMEATRDGLWDWNLLTDACYYSSGYYHMLGYASGEFPMEIKSWISLVHPADCDVAMKANQDCLEGRRTSFEIEFRMMTRSGKWCWILSRGKIAGLDEKGRVTRMVGTHVDITERKQAEEAQRRNVLIQSVLREIADAASKSTSLEELYATVNRLMNTILPSDIFHLALLDEINVQIVDGYSRDTENYVAKRRSVGKGLTEYALKQGRSLHITGDELQRLQACGEVIRQSSSPIYEWLGAPLFTSSGKGIGVLAVISRSATQSFHPDDVEVFAIIATQVSMAIERKQAEGVLKSSEEKYRLLVENSHDIIYMLSPEGAFIYVSPAWTVLLGDPVSQVIGHSFQQFVHPDDIAHCLVWLQELLATGQRQEGIEYRVRHIDGTWRWHTSSGVPIMDETGAAIHFYGIAKDITERKQAEESLRSSQARYQALMEQSYEAQALVDIQTQEIVEINRRVTELFGYSLPEDAPLYAKQVATEPLESTNVRYATLNEQRFLPPATMTFRHKNGTAVLVERAGTVITLDGRDYLLVSMRDLTIERRREAELAQDVGLAGRVQRELLPALPASPFVTLRSLNYPWHAVSGDSYQMEWRNEGTLLHGFLVDISGHGLGTALQTASISVLLREVAGASTSLLEQVQQVNAKAAKYFAEGSYAALLGFELDLTRRELRYVGAGITKFFINGREILTPGMFVGMWEDAEFEAGVISVAAGDCLHFLTDGFTDALAQPENASFWSPDEKDFDTHVAALERLAESRTLRDDATGICLKIQGLL